MQYLFRWHNSRFNETEYKEDYKKGKDIYKVLAPFFIGARTWPAPRELWRFKMWDPRTGNPVNVAHWFNWYDTKKRGTLSFRMWDILHLSQQGLNDLSKFFGSADGSILFKSPEGVTVERDEERGILVGTYKGTKLKFEL